MRMKALSLAGKTVALCGGGLLMLAFATFGVNELLLTRYAERVAVERQETNMRVAWDVLNQYGQAFDMRDGTLYAGDRALNDFFEPVDRVKRLVGGTATLFMGDLRVSTNVLKPDGSRAVGTTLAKGPVHDAVLGRGMPYRGQADILGTPTSVGTFDQNVWYYIGQKTEKVAFFQPSVMERRVVVVHFDDSGVVKEMKQLDASDGQEVEIVDRSTPTAGRELSFLEQMLGNVGRFSAKDSRNRGPGR